MATKQPSGQPTTAGVTGGWAGAATSQGIDWNRAFRIAAIAAFAIALLRAVAYAAAIPDPASSIGIDYRLYASAAERWLATGVFYQPYQLAGPYHVIGNGEVLYPPIILILLVPFTVLPAALWWIFPIGLTVAAIARMRPAGWSLFAIALLCATHAVQAPIFWGTPVMWLAPAVAWGFLLGWPAAAVLIKPTLLPFVAAGLTHPRGLAVGLVGFAVLAIPFGAMWVDWLTAVRNSDLGLTYAFTQNLLLLVPVVAWLGRAGRPPIRIRAPRGRFVSPT
jgi:hypothetical protein